MPGSCKPHDGIAPTPTGVHRLAGYFVSYPETPYRRASITLGACSSDVAARDLTRSGWARPEKRRDYVPAPATDTTGSSKLRTGAAKMVGVAACPPEEIGR